MKKYSAQKGFAGMLAKAAKNMMRKGGLMSKKYENGGVETGTDDEKQDKKKLSRFEKKFKKARKKGKKTFKFRKRGESIFKKRGEYSTQTLEESQTKSDVADDTNAKRPYKEAKKTPEKPIKKTMKGGGVTIKKKSKSKMQDGGTTPETKKENVREEGGEFEDVEGGTYKGKDIEGKTTKIDQSSNVMKDTYKGTQRDNPDKGFQRDLKMFEDAYGKKNTDELFGSDGKMGGDPKPYELDQVDLVGKKDESTPKLEMKKIDKLPTTRQEDIIRRPMAMPEDDGGDKDVDEFVDKNKSPKPEPKGDTPKPEPKGDTPKTNTPPPEETGRGNKRGGTGDTGGGPGTRKEDPYGDVQVRASERERHYADESPEQREKREARELENARRRQKEEMDMMEDMSPRERRKYKRQTARQERKMERQQIRQNRRDQRRYRRYKRRAAREDRRAARGMREVEGRRISPRRWLINAGLISQFNRKGEYRVKKGAEDFRTSESDPQVYSANESGQAISRRERRRLGGKFRRKRGGDDSANYGGVQRGRGRTRNERRRRYSKGGMMDEGAAKAKHGMVAVTIVPVKIKRKSKKK